MLISLLLVGASQDQRFAQMGCHAQPDPRKRGVKAGCCFVVADRWAAAWADVALEASTSLAIDLDLQETGQLCGCLGTKLDSGRCVADVDRGQALFWCRSLRQLPPLRFLPVSSPAW